MINFTIVSNRPGIAVLITMILWSSVLFGQSIKQVQVMKEREKPIAKTAISLEIGGNALIYSLNFDRVLIQSPFYKGTVRIGMGIIPYTESVKDNRTFLFVPIEYNNLFGPKNHFLEVSLGTTYSNSLQGASFWMTGRVGYRMQHVGAGFFFRAGLVLQYIPYANPLVYRGQIQDVLMPLPGISWGMCF